MESREAIREFETRVLPEAEPPVIPIMKVGWEGRPEVVYQGGRPWDERKVFLERGGAGEAGDSIVAGR